MFVAYDISHNEGVESGILDGPDQRFSFSDIAEGDGTIATFDTKKEAEDWIKEQQKDDDDWDS